MTKIILSVILLFLLYPPQGVEAASMDLSSDLHGMSLDELRQQALLAQSAPTSSNQDRRQRISEMRRDCARLDQDIHERRQHAHETERGFNQEKKAADARLAALTTGFHRKAAYDAEELVATAAFGRAALALPAAERKGALRAFETERVRTKADFLPTLPAEISGILKPPAVGGGKFVGLAIDGGGIKGLMPALLFAKIEEMSGGRRMGQLVDCIGGTSIGGILAAGIAVANEHKAPRYGAAEFVRLFREQGARIFPDPGSSFVKGVKQFLGPVYSPEPLEGVLRERFGTATLTDVVKPVIITAITRAGTPFVFETVKAQRSRSDNYYLRDVTRATSAAPTYFPAANIKSIASVAGRGESLLDGGLFANNPARFVYDKMQVYDVARGCTPERSVILSFGTGETGLGSVPREAGIINGGAILAGMMGGNCLAIETYLKETLRNRYMRIQPRLPREVELDDIGEVTLDTLGLSALREEIHLEPLTRFLAENYAVRNER